MNKGRAQCAVYIVTVLVLTALAFGAGMYVRKVQDVPGNKSLSQQYEIYIGQAEIKDYVIFSQGIGREPAKRLSDYIEKVSGQRLKLQTFGKAEKWIKLVKDTTIMPGQNGITIENGNVTIRGCNASELEKQVNIFANSYLGIAFAGEVREHALKQEGKAIHIPDSVEEITEPWNTSREPIICLWKTDAPRGVSFNPATSLKSELLSYSNDQLYQYVKMMKAIGYTGIQVTDMCSAWAYYGNYEFVHDRIRYMADAAHSLGMEFTLWVWGAEFNGYGWTDDTVDYNGDHSYAKAYDNPATLKTFDKYYSIYAELADCCDRVIAHYNDPGNLHTTDEIAYFAKTLREKFRTVKPDVNFGVSCYTHEIDVREINNFMGGDVTVYLGAVTNTNDNWAYEREVCRDDRIDFGIWSWNLTEQEIDQLAVMNVNASLIKDVYQHTAVQDPIAKPSYWSEMESYHVLNLFSHYCAAQLLMDPNRDEQELLYEVSKKVVGAEYAGKLYDVLRLIEDARTGKTWESFKWDRENYVLESDSYDADAFMDRAEKCLKELDEMSCLGLAENEIPLPVSVTGLLELIKPHVQQIRDFAQFRGRLDKLYEAAEAGASKLQLQYGLSQIATPVSEYNVIVGVWGIPEARAQYELMERFCEQYELTIPQDPTFIYFRKFKIYNEFVTWQRRSKDRVSFSKGGFQWSAAYGPDETVRLTQQLVEEGLLTELEDGSVYVTDWKKYRFDD